MPRSSKWYLQVSPPKTVIASPPYAPYTIGRKQHIVNRKDSKSLVTISIA
jgi:hypothetical protein